MVISGFVVSAHFDNLLVLLYYKNSLNHPHYNNSSHLTYLSHILIHHADLIRDFHPNIHKIIYLNNGGIIKCAILSNNIELIKWYYNMYKITKNKIYKIKNTNRSWTKIQLGNMKLNKELEELEYILKIENTFYEN